MGVDLQYLMRIKNSFLEIVIDEDVKPRRRAVSDFTGLCAAAKDQQLETMARRLSPVHSEGDSSLLLVNSDEERRVSRSSCAIESLTSSGGASERTTVMLRNVPNAYSTDMLLMLLDSQGFLGLYDFVYLPVDFRTNMNLGYAFVNLVSHQATQQLTACLQGFRNWICESHKVCQVSWAQPHQGLLEHIERYRNSPVMHESVPLSFKPRLFVAGRSVPLPPPTKRIRVPRMRQGRESCSTHETGRQSAPQSAFVHHSPQNAFFQ